MNGRAIATPNERGEQVVDDTFYVMCNASHETMTFTLPDSKWAQKWQKLLETDEREDAMDEGRKGDEFRAGDKIDVQAWSLALLCRLA